MARVGRQQDGPLSASQTPIADIAKPRGLYRSSCCWGIMSHEGDVHRISITKQVNPPTERCLVVAAVTAGKVRLIAIITAWHRVAACLQSRDFGGFRLTTHIKCRNRRSCPRGPWCTVRYNRHDAAYCPSDTACYLRRAAALDGFIGSIGQGNGRNCAIFATVRDNPPSSKMDPLHPCDSLFIFASWFLDRRLIAVERTKTTQPSFGQDD